VLQDKKTFQKHCLNQGLEASRGVPGAVFGSGGRGSRSGWVHIAFQLGIWTVLGTIWERLGSVLGASWTVPGRLLERLGPFRGVWETFWDGFSIKTEEN